MSKPTADDAGPSRLSQLAAYVIESLVNEPEQVSVQEISTDTGRVIRVRVSEADVGRVIGRQGRTIRAVRTLLGLARRTLGETATLEVVED